MSETRSVFLVAAATAASILCGALLVATPAAARAAYISVNAYRVNESAIARVGAGMSRDEVAALIGAPAHTMRFPLSRTTSWDYDFVDTWGYRSELSVIFGDDGVVASKVVSRNDY